eukprot:g2335.t1
MLCASNKDAFVLSSEVQSALTAQKPVVALESTIITHGMPYPENLATAKSVEALIRAQETVPATIAILQGTVRVGLTESELDHLAREGHRIQKCSIRDLPLLTSQGLDGATTVATTMHLAHLSGIGVFVTGGIGGVHRGGENSFDISADLDTAGRVSVLVVCAGAKSVLDIPRTLEYLETQGVCVAGYQTDEFPAFFTPLSGCKAPVRVDSPEQAAALLIASKRHQLDRGVILGVPIAQEDAAAGETVENATKQALKECEEAKIEGPEVTPFLLKRIADLTSGESLEANIKLVKNNAKVGCLIAKALCKMVV